MLFRSVIQHNFVRSILVNSASTLRSLHVETGTWNQGDFLFDLGEVASRTEDQSHIHLDALESLSLIGLCFDQRIIRTLEGAIDFMNLSELTVGPVSLRSTLLFQLLTRVATVPGTAIALRKLSLVMSSELNTQRSRYPGADLQFEEKIFFISSFDCLTLLEL